MKNRIIALILVCVMSALALASCGAAKFNFAENSSEYVTVDLEGFKKAIAAIEIEDADFTTNEETRAKKVVYNILGSLTSAAIKNNDKLTTGTLTENDVLYFCYYCTYTDDDGVEYVFYGDQMKASAITTSTTKANHVVELATVLNNEDAKLGNALYAALTEKFDEDGDGKFEILLKNEPAEGEESVDLLYDTITTSGTAVEEGDTIVISYTRKPVLADDASDEEIAAAKTEKVLYMELVLDKTKYEAGSEEAILVDLLLGENMTVKVGSDISRTDKDEEEKETSVKEFELTVEDVTYTYSEIGVEWKVEKNNGELFSFTYTPYPTTSQKLENNKLHATDADKIDIKGKELTYHVYPVSYIDVSEISAESIVKDIFGSNITTSSMEIFADESYKNGEDTIKALVETLGKLWKENVDTIKDLKNAEGTLISDLITALAEAETALKEAEGELKKEEAQKKVDDAQKAYDDAIEYCIDEQVKKILAATNGEKVVGDILVEEYKSEVYDSLKASYDSAIVDAVGDELWLLIEKYVVVNSYPEAMVEEFYDHIYEQHEYDFYNGKYTTSSSSSTTTATESNYSHYKGDLEAYLVDATSAKNGDYKAAITDEAKEYLKPLLQVFALSAAIEGDSSIDIAAVMKSYTEADEKAGAYKIYSHEGHDHGEGDHEEEEEQMKEAYENALADAEHFLVDDDALKAYKKYIGKASYKAYLENYGETNLRAALQLNRLMYYLLSTNVSYDDEGTKHIEYKTVGEGDDAVVVIDFRTVSYIIKDEAEDDKDAE
ncbi:MAG: hypothetical protein IJW03_04050 [Clostridia bacterium]|nr:hypothetical protein [Clostridia bacterium]